MGSAKPPIWVVLKAHFLADARKTGVLVVLVIIMVIVFAKYYLKSGSPSEADASPSSIIVTNDSSAPPRDRLKFTGSKRMVLAKPMCRQLKQNPFSVDLEKFPLAGNLVNEDESIGARTVLGQADEAIREAASELRLQGTMVGDMRIACINDQFVQLGDEIAGFVVERIETTSVVLRSRNVRVVLPLTK